MSVAEKSVKTLVDSGFSRRFCKRMMVSGAATEGEKAGKKQGEKCGVKIGAVLAIKK